MAADVRRVAGGDRHHARDRRALPGRDRARQDADPALPDAGGRGRRRPTCAGWPTQGLRERYGDPPPAEAVERLEMELGVIEKMGFSAYFLIVWDFVKFAKDNGIAVGPGRGSAAGSIVSYALSITDVDPLEYDLLFERFLNAERDLDAGHRHRLLGEGPRARDPVRGGQVRPRVGRADHHLRPDVPARRHARRRARARLRLRRGRPAGQADPGAGHGPVEDLRRVPRRGARPPARSTTRSPRRAGSSTPRRASRGSSATPRSTRPPS